MSVDIERVSADVTRFWEQYGALVILGSGLLAVALIGWALVRFARTGNKSKVVGGVAAVVVMLWTSEGLLAAAVGKFGIPWQFAGVAFFVFEAMMLAAALKAEENRRARGLPGAAGLYVFVIALVSGLTASFGADTAGLVMLRIVLPPLAVGLWWILLTSDREDDSEEIQAKRAEQLAAREAQWAITPNTLMIRWGIRKPGQTTTTQAQREHLRDRMVALADRAETLPDGRRRQRLVRRLRVLTRGADRELVAEVAERVAQARQIEQLVMPWRALPDRSEAVEARAGRSAIAADDTDRDASSGGARLSGGGRQALPAGAFRAVPEVGRPIEGAAHRAVDDPEPGSGRAVPGTPVPDKSEPVGHPGPSGTTSPVVGRPVPPARRSVGQPPSGPIDPEQMTEEERREDARRVYRASVDAGQPLKGAELARMYGQKDPKWGTRRINDVRGAAGQALSEETGAFPVVVPATAGAIEQQEDERR